MKRLFAFRLLGIIETQEIQIPIQDENIQEDNVHNWYEIFVYSFAVPDGDQIGDFRGATEKLDYVRGMGFTGIWLLPIMPSQSYHKYDVTD